jgi:hypothetical protein
MAKLKTAGGSIKVSFGKRKTGATKKTYNKHVGKPKAYKGQGR